MSRRFDGVDDEVRYPVQAASNFTGAHSVAVMARFRDINNVWHGLIEHVTSAPADALAMEVSGAVNRFGYSTNATTIQTSGNASQNLPNTTDWLILVATKAAGTVAARLHMKNLTAGTAWTHLAAAGTTANPVSQAGGAIRIGEFLDTDPANMNLAADAGWGAELSDAQVEALTANMGTWVGHAVPPAYCHQHNQATATEDIPDLMGNGHVATGTVTSTTDTSGISGTAIDGTTDPPGVAYVSLSNVREFDGVDDQIALDDGTIGALANGAHSIVMVMKPTTVSTTDKFFWAGKAGAAGAGGTVTGLYMIGVDSIAWGADGGDSGANTGLSAAWKILGFSKTAGTTAPRLHSKQLGSGSWFHVDGSATVADQVTDIASFVVGGIGGGFYMDCRVAAVAVFDTALSDADWEAIEAAPTTQKLIDLGAVAMWDLNQASTATAVPDIVGDADQAAITGTSVVSTAIPGGWTFGPSASPPSVRATASGIAGSLTVPAGTQPGDWLVLFFGNDTRASTSPAPTVAAGGGDFGTDNNLDGNDFWVHMFAREAVASDAGASLTWTGTMSASLVVVRDTDGLGNFTSVSQLAGVTVHPLTGLTVAEPNSLLLASWALDSSTLTADPWAGDAGWTDVIEIGVTAGTGAGRIGSLVQSKVAPTGGAVTGPTATAYQGQESGGFLLTMLPVPSAPTSPPNVIEQFYISAMNAMRPTGKYR